MSKGTDNTKPADNMELLKEQASACGPGCSCNAGAPSNRMRWIVGGIILVAAAALVARAVVKNNGAPVDQGKKPTGFATVQDAGPAVSPSPGHVPSAADAGIGRELASLSELNAVAADTAAVFVFLPGKSEAAAQAPRAQVLGATKTIEANGVKIGSFTLKAGTPDYDRISKQMTVPGVIAFVKGGGASAVSGDITEAKLVQAFVAASSAGGCGPSGCGPSGCP